MSYFISKNKLVEQSRVSDDFSSCVCELFSSTVQVMDPETPRSRSRGTYSKTWLTSYEWYRTGDVLFFSTTRLPLSCVGGGERAMKGVSWSQRSSKKKERIRWYSLSCTIYQIRKIFCFEFNIWLKAIFKWTPIYLEDGLILKVKLFTVVRKIKINK